MLDAVFISDLHLHPDESVITSRFYQFIKWAALNTQSVYILGDFFHVWPGDDALDEWSASIAKQLAWLAAQGVTLYFMPGNRDFLLGDHFLALACVKRLVEPMIITLNNERILLVHGDRYCTQDKGHQWLRRLTRNRIFPWFFLRLSYALRNRLVNKVRQHSQANRRKSLSQMDVVPLCMLSHMDQLQVKVVIHGHTHKPGLTTHDYNGTQYRQYVLSDWDDSPHILCYDKPMSFYYDLISGERDE